MKDIHSITAKRRLVFRNPFKCIYRTTTEMNIFNNKVRLQNGGYFRPNCEKTYVELQ